MHLTAACGFNQNQTEQSCVRSVYYKNGDVFPEYDVNNDDMSRELSFIYLWIMEYLFRQSSLCPARPSWMWQNWGRLLSYHPGQIINGQTILCSKLQSNVVEIWKFSHKYTFLCIITKNSLLDTLFPTVHLKYIILTLKQLIIMKNV